MTRKSFVRNLGHK